MSDMIVCPHCGAALPPVSELGHHDTVSADADAFPEEDVPAVPLLASGSNDDAFGAPAVVARNLAISPDPILGSFTATPKSRDLFPAIDLNASHLSTRIRSSAGPEGDGPYEDESAAKAPWTTVLLASYASATTLALGWLLLTGRGREARPVLAPPPIVDRRADPGSQASLSRVIEPPKPLAADRITVVGRPLKIGAIEVRPVDVKKQDVLLKRIDLGGRSEQRVGGRDAFVVRLRLQNLSDDLAFAPLEPAFVREHGEVAESFIEAASGTKIYPYPLAIESELSIVGQDFSPLRPGESRVVSIASTPDAPGDDQGPFLWRIRLRTGIDQVESIGVRWSATTRVPPPAKK